MDGDGDYALTQLVPRSGNYSFSAWVNCKNIHALELAVGTGESTAYGIQAWGFYGDPPRSFFCTGDGNNTDQNAYGVGSLEVDIWYHIVCTHSDNGYNRIYINGQLDAESVHNGGVGGADGLFALGCYGNSGSWPWNGYIDEFCLWDRELTSEEVSWLFNNPNTQPSGSAIWTSLVEAFFFPDNSTLTGYNGTTLFLYGDAQLAIKPEGGQPTN